MSVGLTKEERDLFVRLADVLVPEAEEMPAASIVGVGADLLDQVLNYRPDLYDGLKSVLHFSHGRAPADAIAQLYEQDPESLRALGLLVAGAYYLSPAVRLLVGYPGQERRPYDPDVTPEYIANGLLGRVQARGSIWRKAPR